MIEVHARRSEHLSSIADALGRIAHERAHIDEETRRVTVGVDSDGGVLTAALRSVEETGVQVDDIALRQPTLDEVFLALTGAPIDTDDLTPAARRAA